MSSINLKQKVFVMHVYNDACDYTIDYVNISKKLKFKCEKLLLKVFDIIKDFLKCIDLIYFTFFNVTFIIGKCPFANKLYVILKTNEFLIQSCEYNILSDATTQLAVDQCIERLAARMGKIVLP